MRSVVVTRKVLCNLFKISFQSWRIQTFRMWAGLLESKSMSGKRRATTMKRFKHWALISSRKLRKLRSLFSRFAMKKCSNKMIKPETLLIVGKGFQFSASSYTLKVLGWPGDAKKWCGAHSIKKLPMILASGKESSQVSFTQVLLKDLMLITKSAWVHGPSQRPYLNASTKPCIFPMKCFKIWRTLQMDQEMKKPKPSKSKVSSPAPSTSTSLQTKRATVSNLAKRFFSRSEWTLNTTKVMTGKTIDNSKTKQVCF